MTLQATAMAVQQPLSFAVDDADLFDLVIVVFEVWSFSLAGRQSRESTVFEDALIKVSTVVLRYPVTSCTPVVSMQLETNK